MTTIAADSWGCACVRALCGCECACGLCVSDLCAPLLSPRCHSLLSLTVSHGRHHAPSPPPLPSPLTASLGLSSHLTGSPSPQQWSLDHCGLRGGESSTPPQRSLDHCGVKGVAYGSPERSTRLAVYETTCEGGVRRAPPVAMVRDREGGSAVEAAPLTLSPADRRTSLVSGKKPPLEEDEVATVTARVSDSVRSEEDARTNGRGRQRNLLRREGMV